MKMNIDIASARDSKLIRLYDALIYEQFSPAIN